MTIKKFGKIVKPLFSEKVNKNENITLVENNNIISSEIEIAEKLNAFFRNIVKELNIKVKEDLLCDVQILTIQLKELFRNTKAILAYK